MRRRPYSELLALASPSGGTSVAEVNHDSGGLRQERPGIDSAETGPGASASEPGNAPVSKLTEACALRYRAEIRNLSNMVEQEGLTEDSKDRDVCAYVSDKLRDAASALDRGDEEASWIHLYGAGTLWNKAHDTPN